MSRYEFLSLWLTLSHAREAAQCPPQSKETAKLPVSPKTPSVFSVVPWHPHTHNGNEAEYGESVVPSQALRNNRDWIVLEYTHMEAGFPLEHTWILCSPKVHMETGFSYSTYTWRLILLDNTWRPDSPSTHGGQILLEHTQRLNSPTVLIHGG